MSETAIIYKSAGNKEEWSTFEKLNGVVRLFMPDCLEPMEVCLSLVGAAMLSDVTHCMGVILVGQSGGRKTTTLSMLGDKDPVYITNNFTPASFVSHDATKKAEELSEIDLLPRIKHKIIVIPENGPNF